MNIQIYFDGGARNGNPGLGYGSYLIVTPDDRIPSGKKYLAFDMTNNQAEFAILNKALRHVHRLCDPPETDLDIYGDSQIVVYGLSRGWNIRSDRLIAPFAEARRLTEGFDDVRYHWLDRRDIYAIFGH